MPASIRFSFALALVLLAVLAACSSGAQDDGTTDIDTLIESTTPTPIVFDPNDPPTLAGRSVNPNQLEEGDCFNEYLFIDASNFRQEVTTVVPCSGPHDREAFFRTEFPSGENARYPLDDELEIWADTTCLEHFEPFVGLDYVLSALEIGAVVPTFEGWTGDGDRAVICYLFPDQGGRLLDSVRNSGI
ncbi:MAG: septum formation family protein [Actinomycetota bacterium]